MKIYLTDDSMKIMDNVFNFYDTNHDGSITMLDLLHAASFVPADSQFGIEINQILESYLGKVSV
jgi:Ca2+-binding EF-hand superfamily protein